MSDKYGFSGGIDLPKTPPAPRSRLKVDGSSLNDAVQAGADLGFVSREPLARLKPGPKRKEPQGKVSIPGPKRVVDEFRAFCLARNITLWQGLELLLEEDKTSGP